MSCDGLTLGKIIFGYTPRVVSSPATCFECYDGTGTEMGRRHFQRWVGCNLGTLKKSSNFSSIYRFPPNLELWVSIRTVLCYPPYQPNPQQFNFRLSLSTRPVRPFRRVPRRCRGRPPELDKPKATTTRRLMTILLFAPQIKPPLPRRRRHSPPHPPPHPPPLSHPPSHPRPPFLPLPLPCLVDCCLPLPLPLFTPTLPAPPLPAAVVCQRRLHCCCCHNCCLTLSPPPPMPLFCRHHHVLSVSTAHCLCFRRTTSDSVFTAAAPLPLFPTPSPPLFPPQPPAPPPPKRSNLQVDWRQRRTVAADTMAMAKPLGRRGLFYEFYLPEKLGRNNYCAFLSAVRRSATKSVKNTKDIIRNEHFYASVVRIGGGLRQ